MLGIVTALIPIILKVFDFWFKKQKVDADLLESYYKFLEQLDQKGLAKVSNFIGAENARAELQEKIKNERLKRGKPT